MQTYGCYWFVLWYTVVYPSLVYKWCIYCIHIAIIIVVHIYFTVGSRNGNSRVYMYMALCIPMCVRSKVTCWDTASEYKHALVSRRVPTFSPKRHDRYLHSTLLLPLYDSHYDSLLYTENKIVSFPHLILFDKVI